MKPTTFILGLIVAAALTSQVLAQQKYTLSNSGTTLYKDRNGVALDNQNPAATPGNGQGQLVQFGYFSTATDANLFSGVFIPLAQFNSGDSLSGVSTVPNGRISLLVQFDLTLQATNFPDGAATSSYAALNSYPAAGAPLAIRWYDTTNTSGFYNSVSATNWDWVAPTNTPQPSIVFNPDAGSLPVAVGLSFQSAANPYVAAIPEASTFACVGMGLFMLVTFRRFRRA